MSYVLPAELQDDLSRAARLEWWTLGWMSSVVLVMGAVMGSSQAMKTAWIEDAMSLIPAIIFLVSMRLERKGETRHYPFGFRRVNSLGFLVSAVTLTAIGGLLLFESVMTLVKQEHVTIPPVTLFGEHVWMGWLMLAALVYSVIPPIILGHLKLPLAKRLNDKVLHTDALTQKADWMTGLAGAAGVLGVGLGYWWADAAAAGLISLSILVDGIRALRSSTAELIDGTPRAVDSSKIACDAQALHDALAARYPGSDVRIRETGRFMHAQVSGILPDGETVDRTSIWPGEPERAWRFAQLSFVPPEASEEEDDRTGEISTSSPAGRVS
jgi:cation diffusion facilitator family transporter